MQISGREKYWLIFLCILCVSIFSGCGHESESFHTGGLTVSQEQVASWSRNFNPFLHIGVARWPTGAGIYEPMMIYNSMTKEYVPWLATGYSWENNNNSLVFDIRNGVRWSDGEDFTAADVKFTFDLIREYPALDMRGLWNFIESIEILPNNRLRVNFSYTYVPGFDDIIVQPVVPEHIWSKLEDPVKFTNPNPVATGPFTEIIRFENQIWEIGRNPNYWQAGKPAVKSLRFPAYPTNEQATIALINGEVDWAGNFIPAIDRIYVKKDPDHHKYWFPLTGHSTYFYLNTTKPPFDRADVRKAVSMAIDRDKIVKVAMYDYTVPVEGSALPSGQEAWKSQEAEAECAWVGYDLEKANAILDSLNYVRKENGYRYDKNGKLLEFEIIAVSGWSDWIRASQVISQNLKLAGIKTRVKTAEFGTWVNKMQNGSFDMAIGWTEKGPTPYPLYRGLMASKFVKPVGEPSQINWHRFGNDQADSLCHEFEITSDTEAQLRIIHKLEKLFVINAPAIPLFAEPAWGEFNTSRFGNFPSMENPYTQLSPNYPPEVLLVMVNVTPNE